MWARAKRHYLQRHAWDITHRCHEREFLLKFGKRPTTMDAMGLFEAKKALRPVHPKLHGHTCKHIYLLGFDRAELRSGRLQLVWSYILDYENNKNPYQERTERIRNWKKYAVSDVQESSELLEAANFLNQEGIPKIDCLHIACAIPSRCEYFFTTDDGILKFGKVIDNTKVDDPLDFIKEVFS